MSMTFLKTAPGQPPQAAADIQDTVQVMLARLKAGGAQVALEYANTLDGWTGDVAVSRDRIDAAIATVPPAMKDDIRWAHDNISRFAAAQRKTAQDIEIELRPGLFAGQRQIPLSAAGCYVPGGRYTHIASALMSIARPECPTLLRCLPPMVPRASPRRCFMPCNWPGPRGS